MTPITINITPVIRIIQPPALNLHGPYRSAVSARRRGSSRPVPHGPAAARVDGLAPAAVFLERAVSSERRLLRVLSVHTRPGGTPARASERSLTRRNHPSALAQGPGVPRAFYFEDARDRRTPGLSGAGGAHRAQPADTPARHRAAAGDRNLRQAGIAEPRRIGQGPGRPRDDPGRRTDRAPAPG